MLLQGLLLQHIIDGFGDMTEQELDEVKQGCPQHDIVWLLRSPATVFYEYAADEGALLKRAATEIDDLRTRLAQAEKARDEAWNAAIEAACLAADNAWEHNRQGMKMIVAIRALKKAPSHE